MRAPHGPEGTVWPPPAVSVRRCSGYCTNQSARMVFDVFDVFDVHFDVFDVF